MSSQNISVQKQKKIDLPMKLRRRQSDAKWRASVASCYETLKHIIPVNKRASRRQISKAHIIQQTSNHIQFLEEVMSSLLIEKAKKDGTKNPERWKSEKLEEIKEDFVNQHRKKLENLNAEKRYKKKSYKLLIADENIQQNIQQTAQLREALFESHKELTRSTDLDRGLEQTQINGINVYSYNGEHQGIYTFPAETSLDEVNYNMMNISDVTATEGGMNFEFPEDLDEPVDYSLNGTSMPLDLSVNKTDHNTATLEALDTEPNAAVGQFGGHMIMTSSNSQTDNTSLQIVPETMFKEKTVSLENQLEGKALGCSNDLHLVPDLLTSEKASVPTNIGLQTEAVENDSNDEPTRTPVKRIREPESTPRKLQKTGEEVTGFTPVKLPVSWTDCSNRIPGSAGDREKAPCTTPIKLIECNNQGVSSVGETNEDALMCTEEMWMSSDEETEIIDERLQHTPGHSHRRTELRNLKRARSERSLRQRLTSVSSMSSDSGFKESKQNPDQEVPEKRSLNSIKCRRSLQGLYDSEVPSCSPQVKGQLHTDRLTSGLKSETDGDDTLDETLDFDGYLLFYKKMGAQLHENMKFHTDGEVVDKKMSRLIYESWNKLPHGQKNSLKQLALSEQNSQDSGFCKSPKNMKELEELDNEIWPLPQDIDLNATDEQNIFSPNPLMAGIHPVLKKAVPVTSSEPETFSTTSPQRLCPELKMSLLPGSIVCGNEGITLATIHSVKLQPNSVSSLVSAGAEKLDTKEPHTEDIHADFVLENKDLFLGQEFLSSPSASVDEEVQRYFQDFSPPLSNKLTELH